MKFDYSYKMSTPRSRPTKKRSTSRFPWRTFFLFIVFLIGFITFFTGPRSLIHLYLLYNKREKLRLQKQLLLQEKQQLQAEAHRLETDSQYILRIAREKYNLKKKNEKIIVVKPR